MMDKKIEIDNEIYSQIKNLLINRVVSLDGITIKLNPAQDISFSADKCTFYPPIEVMINVIGINIKTTISYLQITDSGLHVEIDNSPIDLKVIPYGMG